MDEDVESVAPASVRACCACVRAIPTLSTSPPRCSAADHSLRVSCKTDCLACSGFANVTPTSCSAIACSCPGLLPASSLAVAADAAAVTGSPPLATILSLTIASSSSAVGEGLSAKYSPTLPTASAALEPGRTYGICSVIEYFSTLKNNQCGC